MTGYCRYSLHLHCIQLCIASGLRFVCVHCAGTALACLPVDSVSSSYFLFAFICGIVAPLTACLTGNSVRFLLLFAVSHSISIVRLLAMEMNICNFFSLLNLTWARCTDAIAMSAYELAFWMVVFTLPNRLRGNERERWKHCEICLLEMHSVFSHFNQ